MNTITDGDSILVHNKQKSITKFKNLKMEIWTLEEDC